MTRQYGAERMVLAAAGKVDHEALVRLAEDALGGLRSSSPEAGAPAQYQGGERAEDRALEQVHLVLGFEGISYGDDDYYAASVLSSVLGGGMSSRLFQEVREKRGLVYSIYTFSSSYKDGGLFGIYAGTGADKVPELMPVLADELRKVGATVTDVEIDRVKAQLRAGMLMAMENTRARVERLGQHILIYGRPVPPEEIMTRIDAIDRAALARVAERLFAGKPTLAALGRIGKLGPLPAFAEAQGAAE
jgi:predicted Zn-dependent peptidase